MTRTASDPPEGSSDPTKEGRAGDLSAAVGSGTHERKRPATAWRRYGAIAWKVIQVLTSLALVGTKIHDWWIS